MQIYEQTNRGWCKGCGREILWARLYPSDKPHPFDTPLKHSIRTIQDEVRVLEVDASASHFRTCTKAEKFNPKAKKKEFVKFNPKQKELF